MFRITKSFCTYPVIIAIALMGVGFIIHKPDYVTAYTTIVTAAFIAFQAHIFSQQHNTQKQVERAYLVGGGPSTKDGISYMDLDNRGKTPATITGIIWGYCSKEIFDAIIGDKKISTALDDPEYSKKLEKYLHYDLKDYTDVYAPGNYQVFGRVSFSFIADNVFFGKINYLDIFGDSHFSTFKLLLLKNGGSTPLPASYTDNT